MREMWQTIAPRLDLAAFISSTLLRLLLAAFLGGAIGLEREVKHKPAGLRTNMFICFGACMYTVLSIRLGGHGDPERIAAQIVPGIGFIGAGSILHSRGAVSGLTTAATLFVVASIGMAVGAQEYLVAIFATMVILIALNVLGWVETRFNLKPLLISYEVVGPKAEDMISDVNRILEEEHKIMATVQVGRGGGDQQRVQFTVAAKRGEHQLLMRRFRLSTSLKDIQALRASDTE